jgi:hypothetical protein
MPCNTNDVSIDRAEGLFTSIGVRETWEAAGKECANRLAATQLSAVESTDAVVGTTFRDRICVSGRRDFREQFDRAVAFSTEMIVVPAINVASSVLSSSVD